MAFFTFTFLFIHDSVKSRQFNGLRQCIKKGANKLVAAPEGQQRKYAISIDKGQNWGLKRDSLNVTRERVKSIMENHRDAEVWLAAFTGDEYKDLLDKVRFRTLSKYPPKQDTPGVAGIDKIVGWIEREVSEGRLTSRRYAGICVCKTTSSGSHSDHADCAAIDMFGTNKDMERIRDQVLKESVYFNTKYVILYDRIWFPSGYNKPYTGTWHGHVHISVYGGKYNSACN